LGSEGLSPEEARTLVFAVDQQGLLLEDDPTLEGPQRPMAQRREAVAGWHRESPERVSMLDVVRNARPTVLIGVTAQTGLFSESILQEVAKNTERPIVFALSNPTSKCECTPEQVWQATDGKGLVATGSPFRAMEWNGQLLRSSQCNNMYIFPGVGLGALVSKATRITDSMLLAASRAVSAMVTPEQEAMGLMLPEMEDIRKASEAVALAVAKQAREEGLGRLLTDEELVKMVAKSQWDPHFTPYRAG
jgi:malate dehydrogenase (oxaloacetate-decarboxylating)